MDRPVAVGSASGVLSGLIVQLARDFARDTPLEPVVPFLDCPAIEITDSSWWLTFLAGILVGVCIGPAVDLLLADPSTLAAVDLEVLLCRAACKVLS